ncbi:hypothetical protein P3T23_009343 [Paraburkholderia sp. GAS448]|uniref:major capsid family protein n=1 Tax=Paraburkholderia sp. GAS448 TaxID=3035136 RepID=UPI003D1A2FEC
MRNSDFDQLERTFGIVMPDVLDYTTNLIAMDAQPPLVTTPNAGIPAWLANYIDPDFVQILTAPNRAAVILGEAKKGDWTTMTATFPVIESTGEVSSYGDYNENGSVSANADFPQRQSYHYQTMTQWGERQLEMSALARIDYVGRVNIASAIVLDKFQNNTYFYGVSGLQNYGLLNDPRLSPSLAPGPKAFNSGASGPWITNGAVTATANEIYTDIQTLFNELVLQSGGNIEMDARMTLAMAPSSSVALTTTNTYNVNVSDMLRKNFPALRVETAVQYQNPTGVRHAEEELPGPAGRDGGAVPEPHGRQHAAADRRRGRRPEDRLLRVHREAARARHRA